MRTTVGICVFLALFFPLNAAETPIRVETQTLLVSVDAAACHWSAQVKGTEMRLNDVHFLPGDDPSDWSVASSVNDNDSSNFGSFVIHAHTTLAKVRCRPCYGTSQPTATAATRSFTSQPSACATTVSGCSLMNSALVMRSGKGTMAQMAAASPVAAAYPRT